MLKDNKIFEDLLKSGEVDYLNIKENSFIKTYNNKIKYDINFIVPIYNRVDFLQPLHKSFMISSGKSKLKICMTVVEMGSYNQKDYCESKKINYMFIVGEFNKSLAMNFGALFSVNAKSFVFHDVDCLLDSDFFNKLSKNIKSKKSNVIQCFPGRRIYYLSDEVTNLVIDEKIDIEYLNPKMDGVVLDPTPIAQAPGGSIYINRDIFLEVGGYDPEFFVGYAPEDAFFWDKVELLGEKIESCDSPNINIYHMEHERSINPKKFKPMLDLYEHFKNSDINHKLDILITKKGILRKFYSKSDDKLESIIIDLFFKSTGSNKVKAKVITPKITQMLAPRNNVNVCVCGEPINKREFNFCQRCNKLY